MTIPTEKQEAHHRNSTTAIREIEEKDREENSLFYCISSVELLSENKK
jgi:hypothetical protein